MLGVALRDVGRHEVGRVDVEREDDLLDEPFAVLVVVDREVAPEAEMVPIPAENPDAGRVKEM